MSLTVKFTSFAKGRRCCCSEDDDDDDEEEPKLRDLAADDEGDGRGASGTKSGKESK